MSKIARMMQQATAGAAGAGLDVDEVYSTYLYDGTGTGSNLTVTNNIDLSTEGGLVWVKNRDATAAHALFDTVRGQNILESQSSGGQDAFSAYGGSASASYNTNGFGINGTGASNLNQSGVNYVSWTFRKAPKFFDIQTWTGNGTARAISHNLGSTPGMVIYKNVTSGFGWQVYHRGMAINKRLELADTGSASSSVGYWDQTTPVTSAVLNIGTDDHVNKNGDTFVAYLFAHNDSDGGFGPDGDQDIIKCGSYTGNGSSTGPVVNLGFEPQWIIVKGVSQSGNWTIIDSMRGIAKGANAEIMANLSNAEGTVNYFDPQATGFQLTQATYYPNSSGETYIYMAIRRGPLAAPEDATKVFFVDSGTAANNVLSTGFNPDMSIVGRTTGGSKYVGARLTGSSAYLFTDSTAAEASYPGWTWDESNQFKQGMYNANNVSWTWKRAPGYFDAVAFSKTTSGAQNVSHNLGAVPEMMWIKVRNDTDNWTVYHSALGNDKRLLLNGTDAATGSNSIFFNNTTPTASQFTIGSIAANSYNFIAYLFATVAGVSKVGSYTGNGSTQNIDCGFSNGARFVLIKQTGNAGHWVVFDTARGIVAGNDARLKLNNTDAEVTSYDDIDAHSAGFTLNNVPLCNTDGASYIFYAIA